MPPRVPTPMVRRARLTTQLDAGARGPLTLVTGAPGAGKSALLSSWAADRDIPTAWLSLDSADGDPHRFLRGVLEALRRAGVGDPVASLKVQPREDVEPVVPALVNALEQLPEPVVVVIDDLHEIGDAPALAWLDLLLILAPPTLRVVVATRADPPLRIGRLRVDGSLTEIRADELAFTLAETEQLLGASGVGVPARVAESLWERTEGWAAGLRLAALTMRSHPDPTAFVADFAGDDKAIAEYLLAEVLARQPSYVRDFLLRLAIVDAANAELAAAVTGRVDSAGILARLERDHALLSSTGEARTWYRLHPLFADLLRSEMRFAAAGAVPELHRRAARWFDANARPLEALRHAAAAKDWAHVARLAGEHWVTLLLEGEIEPLGRVLERMPEDLRHGDPELALAFAAVHVDAGEEVAAHRWFDLARDGRTAVPPARCGAFDLAVATVGLMRGRLRGDLDAAMQHAQTMFERDAAFPQAPAAPDDLRALALTELGIAELWSGDLDRARRELEAARGAAAAAGRDWLALLCMAYLGADAMLRGRYDRGTRLVTEAEALARRRGWCNTWPIGITATMLSAMAFQRNRLDEAEAHLHRAAERVRGSGDRPLRAVVALQRARLLAARGQPERAFDALQEARQWLHGWPIMPAMVGTIAGLEATVIAASGELVDVDAVLSDDPSAEAAVVRARLRLHAGDPAGALAALTPYALGSAVPVQSTRTEAWVVAALAYAALDDGQAAAALESALDAAEVGDLQRPFLMHGATIAPLLRSHLRNGTRHRALLGELLAALGQRGGDRPLAMLPEALSEREEAVLRYLPTMMSNQEIAAELYVSVNTVKTHLKSIYRKLDADDRRGAVRRARDLSLLGPG